MIEVRLALEDWQRVLAVLAQAPWQSVNGVILAIGEQLRTAQPAGRPNGPLDEAEAPQRTPRRPPPS